MRTENRNKRKSIVNRTKRLSDVTIAGIFLMTIYKILMINISGDSSIAYFSVAFELFLFISASFGIAISKSVEKMTAARMHREQFHDIILLRRVSVGISFFYGIITGLVLFFLSDFLSKLFLGSAMASFSVKVLSVCLIPVLIAAPLKGYFQGIGSMMPSAIGQLVEKFILLIVAIPLGIVFFRYGIKVSNLMHNDAYAPSYGSMGASFSILIGSILELLFLFFVFFVYNRQFKHLLGKGSNTREENWKQILIQLFKNMSPILLYGSVFQAGILLDQFLFSLKLTQIGKLDQIPLLWGNYYGKFLTLILLAAVLVSSQGSVLEKELISMVGRVDTRLVKDKIHHHMQIAVMMSLPWVAFLGLLAQPVVTLFFKGNIEIPVLLLRIGCVAVLFLAIALIQFHIFAAIKKLQICALFFLIATALHIPVLLLLIEWTALTVEAVVISELVCLFVFVLANQLFIRKFFKIKNEPGKYLLISFTSFVAVGIVLLLIDRLLYPRVGSLVAVVFGFVLTWVGYLSLLVSYKAIDSRILSMLPFGEHLTVIATRLHLISKKESKSE